MIDHAPEFADAYDRFQQLDKLTLVEDTLESQWAHGRAQYLAFLVRLEDAAAQEYASRVQERLAGISGVDPYPDWYLHMTVKGAGFQVIKKTKPDDVLRQDVAGIANKARKVFERQAAFEARLGPANGFPEVVILEVHDGGRIRELNTLLCDAMPELYRNPFDGALFLPHVSIARFTSGEGLPQLRDAIASLREEPSDPAIPIRRIEFVKVWLSETVPEFDTLATYALAAR